MFILNHDWEEGIPIMQIDWTLIIGLVLGAIFGWVSSYSLWDIKNNQHRKKIASALKVDITKLNERVRTLAYIDKIQQIHSWGGDNAPFLLPLYETTDLYYSIRTDISIFNEELASKIHEFYKDILNAEKYRQKLIQDRDIRFDQELLNCLTPIDGLTWEILPLLNKEINASIYLPRVIRN